MTMEREPTLSFDEAVAIYAKELGCSREEAIAVLRKANASGELPFLLEDPETGELEWGDPEYAKHFDQYGWPYSEKQ
jgi:hypothetical protein